MVCPKCGEPVNENEKFCQACGASVTEEAPETVAESETVVLTETPENNSVKKKRTTLMLVFGIISFVFANPYACIISLVFAILTKVQKKKYVAEFGAPTGGAKVGANFGNHGFAMSIAILALYVLLGIVFIILSVLFASAVDTLIKSISDGDLAGAIEEFFRTIGA